MKMYWRTLTIKYQNLSLREKIIIGVLGVLLLCLAYNYCLINPLNKVIETKKTDRIEWEKQRIDNMQGIE